MKKRCIMIFPEFYNAEIIDEIRAKYDPLAGHVRPHITLVFPFTSDISSESLRKHLVYILSDVIPLKLVLKGITPVQSFGNYLFLNVGVGKEEICNIHKKLYTGILEWYFPEWLKNAGYLPHMTIGRIENEEEYKAAILEVKDISETFETTVNKISVEIIDENEDSKIEMEIELK